MCNTFMTQLFFALILLIFDLFLGDSIHLFWGSQEGFELLDNIICFLNCIILHCLFLLLMFLKCPIALFFLVFLFLATLDFLPFLRFSPFAFICVSVFIIPLLSLISGVFGNGRYCLAEPTLYVVKYSGLYLTWRFAELCAML